MAFGGPPLVFLSRNTSIGYPAFYYVAMGMATVLLNQHPLSSHSDLLFRISNLICTDYIVPFVCRQLPQHVFGLLRLRLCYRGRKDTAASGD